LRRRFSPGLRFGWSGDPGFQYSFRPMTLRHRFSPVLLFSAGLAILVIPRTKESGKSYLHPLSNGSEPVCGVRKGINDLSIPPIIGDFIIGS
jgi:hypothetical protein